MALLDVGTDRQVRICELLSNGNASCGNNLNPDNVVLDYVHEFPNGNVVLRNPNNNVLYFFDSNSSTLTRLTSYRDLNNTTQTIAGGITIPTGSRYYATPNFLFMYNGSNLVAVSRTGNVIMDVGVNITTDTPDSDIVCERVAQGANTFRLNTDGTISIIPPNTVPRVEAAAGGKFLISLPNPATPANRDVYLSDSRCERLNDVLVASNLANFTPRAVKMVASSGAFYIAIRYGAAGTTVDYYRVTGNVRTVLRTGLALRAADQNLYEIDGLGNLYYNEATDNIRAVTPNGALLAALDLDGAATGRIDGILAFENRVLIRDNSGAAPILYNVSVEGTPPAFVSNRLTAAEVAAHATPLQRCTDGSTRSVNGRGTSLVRCVFDDSTAGGERLIAFLHRGSGVYTSGDIQINNTSAAAAGPIGPITRDHIRFGANSVLVPTRTGVASPHVINLCPVTTSPTLTVFCSPTDLPNPVSGAIIPLADTTRIYPFTNLLKFNGNNVLYLSGASAPFIPKFGDIFSTPQTATIPINSASGGNASFDLTKFAYNFGSGCITSIGYLPSLNASPKIYTVAQPSNACVNRILKVY